MYKVDIYGDRIETPDSHSTKEALLLQQANKETTSSILDMNASPWVNSNNTTPPLYGDQSLDAVHIQAELNSMSKIQDSEPRAPYTPVPKNLDIPFFSPLVQSIVSQVSYATVEKLSAGIVIGVSLIVISSSVSWVYWLNQTLFNFMASLFGQGILGWFVIFGMILAYSLEKFYTLEIGRYSKIIVDNKKGSVDYHILRNLADLQVSYKDMQWLKNNNTFSNGHLQILIRSKKEQLLQDILNTLPEVVNELYASGKIKQLNTIEFDSYLLMTEETFESLYNKLQETIPYGTLSEMPQRPIGLLTRIWLRAQELHMRMMRHNISKDTWYKKVFSQVITSENVLARSIMCIFTYGWQLVPYIGRSKKNFKYTRGIHVKLPKEIPSTKIS